MYILYSLLRIRYKIGAFSLVCSFFPPPLLLCFVSLFCYCYALYFCCCLVWATYNTFRNVDYIYEVEGVCLNKRHRPLFLSTTGWGHPEEEKSKTSGSWWPPATTWHRFLCVWVLLKDRVGLPPHWHFSPVAITPCSPRPCPWSPGEKPRGGFSWKERILLFLFSLQGLSPAVQRGGEPVVIQLGDFALFPPKAVVMVGLFWELCCPRLSLWAFLVWLWTWPLWDRAQREGKSRAAQHGHSSGILWARRCHPSGTGTAQVST